MSWLFLILLLLDSDIISAALMAVIFWSMSDGQANPVFKRFSLFFACVSIRGIFEMIAYSYGFSVRPVYTNGFIVFYVIGRAAKTISIWWLLLHFIRIRNNTGPKVDR